MKIIFVTTRRIIVALCMLTCVPTIGHGGENEFTLKNHKTGLWLAPGPEGFCLGVDTANTQYKFKPVEGRKSFFTITHGEVL